MKNGELKELIVWCFEEMKMKIDYTILQFDNISLKTRHGAKLRGFFANNYKAEEVMHNHKGDKLVFKYPKVQYKIIDNIPIVCGIQNGANILSKIGFEIDQINIEGKEIQVLQKHILKKTVEFGVTNDYIKYKFVTPWVALNQKNVTQYKLAKEIEREELLKKILVGNILSMAKGLNYTVDKKICVWLNVDNINVNFKNIKMSAFVGFFKVNFEIPDYFGLGKSVSRGFGTIVHV